MGPFGSIGFEPNPISSPSPPGCSLESAFDTVQDSQKPLFLSKIETSVSFPYLCGKGLIQKKITTLTSIS